MNWVGINQIFGYDNRNLYIINYYIEISKQKHSKVKLKLYRFIF